VLMFCFGVPIVNMGAPSTKAPHQGRASRGGEGEDAGTVPMFSFGVPMVDISTPSQRPLTRAEHAAGGEGEDVGNLLCSCLVLV
jgi:hypothetical protein